jgi:hypothetical protein
MPFNFDGLEKKQNDGGFPTCFKCLGYGCWNLQLDFFGENKALKEMCCQCDGQGYLFPDGPDAKCSHEYKLIMTVPLTFRCQYCAKLIIVPKKHKNKNVNIVLN